MKMRIKRPFTLLEMMLALTILVLIASFTTIHIKRLIDTHRFEKQISELFISLQEAQVLSAAYQTDFALDIEQGKGGFFYQFSTDEPFLESKFSQKKEPLSPEIQMKWGDKQSTRLHLDIYSGGRIEPQGVVSFSQSKEAASRVLYIDMQYGHLIKFLHTKPTLMKPLPFLQKPTTKT